MSKARIRIVRCNCGRPGCESFYFRFGIGNYDPVRARCLAYVQAFDYETLFGPLDVAEMIEALEKLRRDGYQAVTE